MQSFGNDVFDRECDRLETQLIDKTRHFEKAEHFHRVVRYAVGLPAVACTAVASATAFSNNPAIAGWLALAGTVLGLIYAGINPINRGRSTSGTRLNAGSCCENSGTFAGSKLRQSR
jgi:hypothetical protein